MAMINPNGTLILSPSDLTTSASCEFGWLRTIDAKLGRIDPVEVEVDAMLARTAALGDKHEDAMLASLKEKHGNVVEIARPKPYNKETLAAAQAQTVMALNAGADVVFQATFFDGTFGGMADFIIRGDDGLYQVWDAKLARRAKITALLQIAAYADQLDRLDIPRSSSGFLRLGDNSQFEQQLDEVIPVYLDRRAKLEEILVKHVKEYGPVEWDDARFTFCGTCDHCKPEITAHDDLMLVAGMRKTQRAHLRAADIHTMHTLSAHEEPVAGMARTFEGLKIQAKLQCDSIDKGVLQSEMTDRKPIRDLPAPSDGDVFFDFEGDPLWSGDDSAGEQVWGLEYLFGVIEPTGEGVFREWWAIDRATERLALNEFLDYVMERRSAHPDMHIYHYASYEITALRALTGKRHGEREDDLDTLIKAGVFVDLYKTVKQSLRVGAESYSLKKLEPLYMDGYKRKGLDNASDSMVFFENYLQAVEVEDLDAVDHWRAEIINYNTDDCVSTWRLRNWLLEHLNGMPAEADISEIDGGDESAVDTNDSIAEIAHLIGPLLEYANSSDERTADEQAAAMVAAAVGFHRREDKPFWWTFFDRLSAHPDDWQEPRQFMYDAQPIIRSDWVKEGRKNPRRVIEFHGELEPASELRIGTDVASIYDSLLHGANHLKGASRCVAGTATITDIEIDAEGNDVVVVTQVLPGKVEVGDELPIGICIPNTISAGSIAAQLQKTATDLGASLPAWPKQCGLDILRRVPPRFATGQISAANDPVEAISDSLRRLDRSCLAVQGPPGTGKTHVGSHVVTELVNAGWKVGVVAQSHSAVEHFLSAAMGAGLPGNSIAKKNKRGDTESKPWAVAETSEALGKFITGVGGGLIGGTAWDFTNPKVVDADALDLLVIDEAGQFSLANTLAVSTSAKRLLLLGDPQQLPQVSQGSHPEPVDMSALEWIADGHDTLPPERGYFLEKSWRMHSSLTSSVSKLSYEDRLGSNAAVTDTRDLAGVKPGLQTIPVDHRDNSTYSAAEAEAVVALVAHLQERTWKPAADGEPRPIQPSDIIVVAPYNAQVGRLRNELDRAGFIQTRAGTVDKFQGQEAAVAIVSMTASSPSDVPRGMEFLLSRNRVNVAISRAQWAAYVVFSPRLTDYLPSRPTQLAELGAFLTLIRNRSK